MAEGYDVSRTEGSNPSLSAIFIFRVELPLPLQMLLQLLELSLSNLPCYLTLVGRES